MTVYKPLADYLATCPGDQLELSFPKLEQILGFRLCHSALTYKAWWSNGLTSPSSQNTSWLSAGWKVNHVDLQGKLVTFTRSGASSPNHPASPPAPSNLMPETEEWYLEKNVQHTIAALLRTSGWSVRTADTDHHQHGIDILARKDPIALAIEVKGYPSATFASGPYKGEVKSNHSGHTNRNLQATHYFSDVLVEVIKRKTQHPTFHIAIALPDFAVYHSSVKATWWAFTSLGIGVYWVTKRGHVLPEPTTSQPAT